MDAPRNVRCFVLCDFEVELVAEQAIFGAVGWATRGRVELRELCFVDVIASDERNHADLAAATLSFVLDQAPQLRA